MNRDKTILVTGASGGIGRAIALDLAKKGYHLVLHYNSNKERVLSLQKEIVKYDIESRLIAFDISDNESVKNNLENDMQNHGAYYGVVCNAGLFRDAAFPSMTKDEWDIVLRTNLDGFYNVIQPCIMPMVQRRKPGRIVVISSVSGVVGNRGQVNYSASKAGLIGASKALAIELAKRNITVNCVAPGLIDTGVINEEILKHAVPMIPMQRVGLPYEVASLVSFLMSDGASYITRQVISVNGGMV